MASLNLQMIWILTLALILASAMAQLPPLERNFDIVIVGATPAGIMAAVAATRASNGTARILILERTAFIGGLPANGLGATDIATRGATAGLFLEFVERVAEHYAREFGPESRQAADSSSGYFFEPKVAEAVLQGFLDEVAESVTVLLGRQFDALPRYAKVAAGKLTRIRVLNRARGDSEWYGAKYFVDATYEGDLIGAARIPYHLGREGSSVYGEIGAGVVYKYWNGEESTGTTHLGDDAIQAYNYRLSMTNDPANVHKVPRPATYNREEYVSLINDIITGCHTGIEAKGFCPKPPGNPNVRPTVPGQPTGIKRIVNLNRVPNNKYDANNQHLAFISTDLPQENWDYPTASWSWRDSFAIRLRSYILGLIYFAQNDPSVPAWYRNDSSAWGLSRDEYPDNEFFPRQIYVREGRRMAGQYVFTSRDTMPTADGARPRIHSDSITSSHYALDSHGVRKRQANRVHLDGFVSYPTPRPYTVPYGVIIPHRSSNIGNVFAPVPMSGSHIGFSTLRMEPCWMALGQAAGVAAALLVSDGGTGEVQDLDVERLQRALFAQDAILIYIPGWEAMTKEGREARQWSLLKGTA